MEESTHTTAFESERETYSSAAQLPRRGVPRAGDVG